jgi:ATP-dependent DNA helicase RecG
MSFLSPVEEIKGVGPKTAAALEKYGFNLVRDLAYYFPRDYEDYHKTTKTLYINTLQNTPYLLDLRKA